MKILIAKFVLEANENVPFMCDIENVAFHFGKEVLSAMQLNHIPLSDDVELIPIFSANAGSSGIMKLNCFKYIENRILEEIRKHKNNLNGICLHLHGASYVENIGSGDFHLLKEIRKIVGPYLPIAIACDPHGNLNCEYVENTQLIRSYRQSPHTDIQQTNEFVLRKLIDLIKNPQHIHSIYRKLPLILGGEQSVSTDEPVLSINKYMDEMEKDPRIRSVSWHVGYIRHDCPEAGCGIVVVPQTEQDQTYCEKKADELAEFVWNKRHEFHYTGVALDVDEALTMVLNTDKKTNFITDSGDNVTSGASGANTYLLRKVLSLKDKKKSFLFASICDVGCFNQLSSLKVGDKTEIILGANYDELSRPVFLEVEVKAKGIQKGTTLFGENGSQFGEGVVVSLIDLPIDIIIANSNHPFVERNQVLALGVDWDNYDVTVVKCGYAFPELLKDGNIVVMALTDGATLQDTARLPFKRIMRPMFPIDKI